MPRRPVQGSIADVAAGVTLVLGRALWLPVKLVWRPVAAKAWNRRLASGMEQRPSDRVRIFDDKGDLLGWGLRMDLDPTHVVYAIPFGWAKRAAIVKDVFGREIKGARFYLGRRGSLLASRPSRRG